MMNPSMAMNCTYNYGLVALSVGLALITSYAALDLSGRVASATGRVRVMWLSGGALAMGIGIWGMHYIGMLAFTMPVAVFYHLPTVGFSLLAAVAASGVALFVVGRQQTVWRQIMGGVAMGCGIASMHYTGMAAMRCAAVLVYQRLIVALSIVLAIAISFVALKLAFRVRSEQGTSRRKIVSALIMGAAIPLMHYTGMWAARFYPSAKPPDLYHSVSISPIGATAIVLSTFLVLATAITSSLIDRYIDVHRVDLLAAQQSELYFHTMAEAVPEIIWTATPEGYDDYFNRRCYDYTGRSFEELSGSAWKDIVHPDDIDASSSKWQNALQSGESYEVEYRLRGKDGNYRWFLGRANPIRNAEGKTVKWFGTCTDIENQKHNQHLLEEQVLERTGQLEEANTRLQEEMIEKDVARNELDQQNEKMMSELQKRSERATLLAKMGELLQSCISRDEVFAAALGFAPKIFPGARGAVALLNGERSLASVIGSWTECQLPLMEFEPSACWALRTGHPHLVLAGDKTARCLHAEGVNHTYLCIPILAQGETLGILHFQATDESPQMESSELSFKTTFAGQVGLSIANIRLREALRTQSVRDALTGLYNRRYLEEVMEREVRRAGRSGQSLGVLMLDLDHFKSFNDTYGHDAGDTVLREAAAFLLKHVRAEDFVCRYGGEEFVVILPTADQDGARARGERFRARMKDLPIMHQGKSLGMVTFSIGVAAFPEHGMSPKELMAAADAALYEAKRGGRDKVVVASSTKDTNEISPAEVANSAAAWG
jgi:diguanylate cyclase (GGDEF)-like protein/PAS domain S-box-containing protein